MKGLPGTVGLRKTKKLWIRMVNQKANLLKYYETVITRQVGVPWSADHCHLFPVG